MNQSFEAVKAYYDSHIIGKLRGFVEGNLRVERAWLTLKQWAPKYPLHILEIGCGIGDICWRMARYWPKSTVVGLDISAKSLEIARTMFGSSRLSFVEGPLRKGMFADRFDLIVLMDVYEHIAVADRSALHEALRELKRDTGRVLLTFPTPRYLSCLKQYHPDQIQPVDENISVSAILRLAEEIDAEILLYQEVDIWNQGDYAHTVLGSRQAGISVADSPVHLGMKEDMGESLVAIAEPEDLIPPRSQRLTLVQQKLGPGILL